MDVVLTNRHTEPGGDTSFNEGKEEDQTEYDGVTSSDVGFLFISSGPDHVCTEGGGIAEGKRL